MLKLIQSQHRATVAVYSTLVSLDVGCAWRFSELYVEPETDDPQTHIQCLNRFWRDQLSSAIVNTASARMNLIDDVDLDDWVRLFAVYVAPAVVVLDLPRQPAVDNGVRERFAITSAR